MVYRLMQRSATLPARQPQIGRTIDTGLPDQLGHCGSEWVAEDEEQA